MDIPLTPVESSHVVAAGYDAQSEVLRIEFKGGRTYDYHGVDEELHKAFEETNSVGGFVQNILRPGCPASEVKEEDSGATE